MIAQINTLLPNWLHNRVTQQLLDPSIDWHFPGFGGYNFGIEKACFAKQPYNDSTQYYNWAGVESLTYALDCWLESSKDYFVFNKLHRCLINFYTPGQSTGWHIDHESEECFSLLYYVTPSDGGTEFRDKKILHCENSGVFFNSNLPHSPILSSSPRRITVNWLMFGELI